MEIVYENKKIRKVCIDAAVAEQKYGIKMALKIQQRIEEISAAETVEKMIEFNIGRCHKLKGDRKYEYAVDLVQPYRLIFEKQDSYIQIVNIIEITDYH